MIKGRARARETGLRSDASSDDQARDLLLMFISQPTHVERKAQHSQLLTRNLALTSFLRPLHVYLQLTYFPCSKPVA